MCTYICTTYLCLCVKPMNRMVLGNKQYNTVFPCNFPMSYDIQFVTFTFLLRFEKVNVKTYFDEICPFPFQTFNQIQKFKVHLSNPTIR